MTSSSCTTSSPSSAPQQRGAPPPILAGADRLQDHPQLGRPLEGDRREHMIPFGAGAYVLRYKLDPAGDPIVIRVWHSREERR